MAASDHPTVEEWLLSSGLSDKSIINARGLALIMKEFTSKNGFKEWVSKKNPVMNIYFDVSKDEKEFLSFQRIAAEFYVHFLNGGSSEFGFES